MLRYAHNLSTTGSEYGTPPWFDDTDAPPLSLELA